MSKGTVNKVILVGRLGADPEVRYTQSGMAIGTLNLATNHSRKDNATGQYVDSTEWHRVTVMAKMAETIQQYAKKGSQLYIEGRLQTRKWQDKEGRDQYTTEIVANEFQFIGGGNQSGGNTAPFDTPSTQPFAQPSAQPSAPKPQYNPQPKPQPKPMPDINQMTGFSDDDIPF